MDPLDWANGWPTVRGGFWASDTPMPAPVAQNGDKPGYTPTFAQADQPGQSIAAASDEFDGESLSGQWSWVRQPLDGTYALEGGAFRFDTQAADIFRDAEHGGGNTASILTEPAPAGDYVVDVKVQLNLPPEGCCYNYVQAGLVIYNDSDNFVKLAHVSIWNTRQTEFAKEYVDPIQGPFYGNTVVGPPDLTTWLRIVKRTVGSEEHYRAYTSGDGVNWVRGGVWTHTLGTGAKIGLVSMGGSGFVARFDYVRAYILQ
jgi:arabinan endo-1,5-alpha-L-arabinosidase